MVQDMSSIWLIKQKVLELCTCNNLYYCIEICISQYIRLNTSLNALDCSTVVTMSTPVDMHVWVANNHYLGMVSLISVCIYGGGDRREQIDAVTQGVEIVVGK